MPSGGHPPDHYRELTPEGNVRDPHTGEVYTGSHQGEFSHLNVKNLRPNLRPVWLRRDLGRLRSKSRWGYRVVQPGDPEYQDDGLADAIGAAVGSAAVVNDVVLCVVDVDDYAKELAHKRERAAAHAGDNSAFLSSRHPAELQYEHAGRPLRYRRSGHGTQQIQESREE